MPTTASLTVATTTSRPCSTWDYFFWNPIQIQVSGADNQLFSDILRELDAMVGCENRSWVEDWPVNRRQAWVDRYILTGMQLPDAGPKTPWRINYRWRSTRIQHLTHIVLWCGLSL